MSLLKDRLLIFGDSSLPKHSLLSHWRGHDDTSTEAINAITLSTKYYTANIQVWIDDSDDLSAWCTEYLKPEALEVRELLNGLVYCFKFDTPQRLEKDLNLLKFLVPGDADEWPGLKTCIGFGDAVAAFEDYEDVALSLGWECINMNDEREFNEFHERVGSQRFKEVVESHGWTDESTNSQQTVQDATDLEQMLERIKFEKARIAKLPEDQRKEEAMRVLGSLNL